MALESLSASHFTQKPRAHGSIRAVDAARGSEGGPGTSVNRGSRRHRRLIQVATVRLPSIRTDCRAGTARDHARVRCTPVPRRMRSMAVIVALEIEELHRQIRRPPKQRAVQTFASNGANQPFDDRM